MADTKNAPATDASEELARMSRAGLVGEVQRLRELVESASNVEIINRGQELILPAGMTYADARVWLKRKEEELEAEVQVYHRISCHPLDGAYALIRAIKDKHGWSSLQPTPGFFGPTPPAMVTMHISATETVQVPWGPMKIPGISGDIKMKVDVAGGDPGLIVGGVVKKRDQHKVYELARHAEHLVNTSSVYHHKALSIKLDWLREGRGFDPDVDGFKFLSVDGVDENGLIFDKITAGLLNVSLFAFIRNAAACRENGIPLKRGILLEGKYGTGKTMTAYVTAKLALRHGFTFVMVEDARDLEHIIRMARRYEPCVIFCEDIDRILTKDRTLSMDALLNTIDGFNSKGSEIMLVLTTNHVEDIHKAMMRPGRLDSVMELLPPDTEAVQRLIRYYAGPRLAPDADLAEVGKLLDQRTPAVIREVVERAKISTIDRTGSSEITGKINGEDLVTAAHSMTRHMELMDAKAAPVPPLAQFAQVLGAQIGLAVKESLPCHSDD